MLILIAIFALLFFILAMRRLDVALLIIIATLPSYLIRFQILSVPFTLLETMILLAALAWLLTWLWPRWKNRHKKTGTPLSYLWLVELGLLIIVSLAAVATAHWQLNAWGIWKAYFLEPILLSIMIFSVFRGDQGREKIYWALLIGAALVAILAIYQKISGNLIANPFWQAAETRRSVSFFGYPNAIGLYLGPIVMLLLGWLGSQKWKRLFLKWQKKLAIIATIVISLLAIVFARSEGALIGLVAGLIVAGFLAGRKLRLATTIVIAASIVTILISPNIRATVGEKLSLQDLSGTIRQQQWKETLLMLQDGRLILGAGLSQYQEALAPYHQDGLFYNSDNLADFDNQLRESSAVRNKYWQPVEIYFYPHNIILNFWSELGLAGLALFAWIIIKFLFVAWLLSLALKRINSRDRYLALSFLGAMIVIVIHGLVDVPYFKNDLSAIFCLILALLAGLKADWQDRLAGGSLK